MKSILRRILYHLKKYANREKKTNPKIMNFGIDMVNQTFFDAPPMQINGGEYIKIGNKSSIGRNAWLGAYDSYLSQRFNPQITIGNNVRIGNYATITAINKVQIGDGCLFSEFVYISDHAHGVDPTLGISPKDQPLNSKGPVIIGENTFVGYRVSILPGVVLGKNCVVGSNAVVTKSFPDYTMVAGIPAKAIKKFSFEKKQWINI